MKSPKPSDPWAKAEKPGLAPLILFIFLLVLAVLAGWHRNQIKAHSSTSSAQLTVNQPTVAPEPAKPIKVEMRNNANGIVTIRTYANP